MTIDPFRLKNFCILPFMHIATTTEGNARLCCKVNRKQVATKTDNDTFNISQDDISAIWNSDYMNNVREKILNDEQLPECNICWREEENFDKHWNDVKQKEFAPSKRIKENRKWREQLDFQSIVENPKISYLDIRLNNLCNLKCRMCWPQFSSQIEKEHEQFKQQGDNLWYSDFDFNKISDITVFWNSLKKNLFDIKEISFVGGEPTLHDEMYDLLDQLVELDVSKSITLKITTNLTNLQTRLLNILPKFKKTTFNISLDGINEVNEYIRYPSNWNQLMDNLEKLLSLNEEKIVINISCVVQIYNMFNIFNMSKWFIEKLKDYSSLKYLTFDILYDPNRLSIKILNNLAKKDWYTVYEDWRIYFKNLMNDIDSMPKNIQDSWHKINAVNKDIIKIGMYADILIPNDTHTDLIFAKNKRLSEQKHTDRSNLREQCIAYTEQLDKHRNQSVTQILPKFYEYLFSDDNV